MKKTIRTLVLILAIGILSPCCAKAQGMPVYDNINFISFAKQLVEAGKQTSNIIKTVKFLKKQKENIEKVSNAIKQLKAVEQLTSNNKKLYKVVQDDLREILNSPYIKAEEVNRVNESFSAILENSTKDLDFINQILSSDNLKMTDAERAKVLKDKEIQSQEMVAEITKKTERYREIISFRRMQDKVNTRETNY
ncbi:conjugal transfer protein [Maribacter sp. 2308TA10-17]|uniref:conjugal transfer protein n=1 Tax=Maribacter sp. 2308TA10-17 TaxID=3386276 RepID=UPI0039BD0036